MMMYDSMKYDSMMYDTMSYNNKQQTNSNSRDNSAPQCLRRAWLSTLMLTSQQNQIKSWYVTSNNDVQQSIFFPHTL